MGPAFTWKMEIGSDKTRHPKPSPSKYLHSGRTPPPWRWRCPAVSAAAGSCPPPPCCRAGWAQRPCGTSHRWQPRSGSFLCSAVPPPGYASLGRGSWNSLKRAKHQAVRETPLHRSKPVWHENRNRRLLVSMVRLLHCSSTSPCFFPDRVNGVSNTKRLMLWCLSKSVLFSCCSFSSK